jgi:hypothetical protein
MCVKTMRKNEMIQGKWAGYKVFPMEACLGERDNFFVDRVDPLCLPVRHLQ